MLYATDKNDNHILDEYGNKIEYSIGYFEAKWYRYKEPIHINDDNHLDSEDRYLIIKEGIDPNHAVCKKQLDDKISALQNSITEIIPFGSIIMWSGLISKIPNGWVICDGQNGTRDLRSRFIIGIGKGNGLTSRKLHDKGGAETHKLTIAEMPSHNHTYRLICDDDCTGSDYKGDGFDRGGNWSKNIKNDWLRNEGGDQPHNNMPPFYALAFIMRIPKQIPPEPKHEPKSDLNNIIAMNNENKPEHKSDLNNNFNN